MRCCWTRRIAHRAARAQTVAAPTTLPTATPAAPAVPPARSAGARAPAPAAPIAAPQRAARAERRRQRTSAPGIGARPRPRAATRGVAHARGGRCRAQQHRQRPRVRRQPSSAPAEAGARGAAALQDPRAPRAALGRTPRTAHTEPRRTGVGAAYKGADRSATVQGRNSVAPQTGAVSRTLRNRLAPVSRFLAALESKAAPGSSPVCPGGGRECWRRRRGPPNRSRRASFPGASWGHDPRPTGSSAARPVRSLGSARAAYGPGWDSELAMVRKGSPVRVRQRASQRRPCQCRAFPRVEATALGFPSRATREQTMETIWKLRTLAGGLLGFFFFFFFFCSVRVARATSWVRCIRRDRRPPRRR